MPSINLMLFSATALLTASLPAQGDRLYSVTSLDGMLRVVDPLTATTVSQVQITNGSSVQSQQCNGLAVNPTNGLLYGLVRFTGAARNLCTIDPATGIATVIGPTSDSFAGIAFRIDGTLFGVTGDGANTPETLYTISLTNAQSTLFRTLGAGNDGETIAFAPDLSVYHASGLGTPNTNEVFERIETFSNVLTPIPLSGYDYDELLSLTSWVGGNLLGADLNDDLVVITTSGRVSLIGTLDHSGVKGLAFVPSPNTQAFFRPYGGGCTMQNGNVPLLVGSGVPSPGQTVQFRLLTGPATSFGLFALGFGTGSLPIPSPLCQVQIAPPGPATVSFFTNATGQATLSMSLPASLAPMDAYLQMGLIDGSNFVVSNPLQMHLR